MTSAVTVDTLRLICSRFGLPDTIVSDNGPAFVGEEFQRFTKANGIRHVKTAPYRPASNGLAERYVKEVKYALRRANGGNMTVKLAKWLISYRSTPNATTGVTPASMMFGREVKTRLQLLKPDLENVVQSQKDRQKASYDKRTKNRQFQVSDRVFARGYMAGPTWLPGVIVDLLGTTMAEVRLDDGRLWRRHFDQLRPGDDSAPAGPEEPDLSSLDRGARHLADGGPGDLAGRRLGVETGPLEMTSVGHEMPTGVSDITAPNESERAGERDDDGDWQIVGTEPVVTARASESPKDSSSAPDCVPLRRSQRERRRPDFFKS